MDDAGQRTPEFIDLKGAQKRFEMLLWIVLPNPAKHVFGQLAQATDRKMLSRLLHALKARFGSSLAMIRESVDKVLTGFATYELREVLREIAD